jgi:hypothetical protein
MALFTAYDWKSHVDGPYLHQALYRAFVVADTAAGLAAQIYDAGAWLSHIGNGLHFYDALERAFDRLGVASLYDAEEFHRHHEARVLHLALANAFSHAEAGGGPAIGDQPLRTVSTSNKGPSYQQVFTSPVVYGATRQPFIVGSGAVGEFTVSGSCFYQDNTGASHGYHANGNAVVIDKVAMIIGTTVVPVTWNSGSRSLTLADEDMDIHSDAISASAFGGNVARGTHGYFKFIYHLAATGNVPEPRNLTWYNGAAETHQEVKYDPAATTISDTDEVGNFTSTGTAPTALTAGSGLQLHLLGRFAVAEGDPKTFINNEDSHGDTGNSWQSFINQAMWDVDLISNPFANFEFARGASSTVSWGATDLAGDGAKWLRTFGVYANCYHTQLGHNGTTSHANDLALRSLARATGLKTFQCYMAPDCLGSANFNTRSGQTPNPATDAYLQAKNLDIVADYAAGSFDHFIRHSQWEDDLNALIWNNPESYGGTGTQMTTDGQHPDFEPGNRIAPGFGSPFDRTEIAAVVLNPVIDQITFTNVLFTSFTFNFVTNQPNGNYWVVCVPTGNYGALSEAQKIAHIKAGTKADNSAAPFASGAVANASSGAKAVSCTGLTSGVTYDTFIVHNGNYAMLDSTVRSGTQITAATYTVAIHGSNDGDANNAAGAVTVTLTATATAGDLLTCSATIADTAKTLTVDDSLGAGGWTGASFNPITTGVARQYFWFKTAAGGETSVTVTPNTGASRLHAQVVCATKSGGTWTMEGTPTHDAQTSTTPDPTAITPTADVGAIAIGHTYVPSARTLTAGASPAYTKAAEQNATVRVGTEYLIINPTSGTYDPSWTMDASGAWGAFGVIISAV